MARCPSCEYPLPDDRERLGARCPSCRDPLYEPAGRSGRPAREDEATCPVHPGVETVGLCARCGNYLCEVCRTRWRNQVLCAACVDRALESSEGAPEQDRSHWRQALFSLLFGASAWGLSALAVVGMAMVAAADGKPPLGVAALAVLVVIADVLVAALGVGLAAAALRTRGSHMLLATFGLILGGLYVGAVLGLGTFGLWQS